MYHFSVFTFNWLWEFTPGVNVSIKPTFTLAIFKKNHNFWLRFILYLNVFVNLETIQYYKTCNLLFYTLLSSAAVLGFTNSTYSYWHVPRKLMGSTITAITFKYFFTDKKRYNPLDYLLLFFFDVEDPACN